MIQESREFAIDRLAELRKAHGLKSHNLSREILKTKDSGYWSRIERTKRIPSVGKLVVLTQYFGISLEILYGTEKVFSELPLIRLHRLKEKKREIVKLIKELEDEIAATKQEG